MGTDKIRQLIFLTMWLCALTTLHTQAQPKATIQEFDSILMTYPFRDPNPVPEMGKIYPYFTFDGYSVEAAPKSWKIVALENPYIRVEIVPEIGGKIWAAYDKTRDKPFIYVNDVVKFRNIAMRGPWTSGGIEFNFGIIGHTPTVSTPVDYHTRNNEDGSVSCLISSLDLLTRTQWVVEINLPKDKARFSTQVYWENPTDLEQPYYTWMNLAVPAEDDLHFVDPGTHYITHGGESHPWPFDTLRKIDLSEYSNNGFEGSKSYHITGKHSDYFGTYYTNTDDGMIHLADRDAKIGKKVFLWALSGAGQIWETLLTDRAGQYVEVQSGRLFNQNAYHSSHSPFKQIGFPPLQSDEWKEYWFPYHGIGKVDFADKEGVWHLDKRENQLGIDFMALAPISDTLKIYIKDGLILEQPLELTPMDPAHLVFQVNPDSIQKITYGKTQIIPEWAEYRNLSRPLSIPDNFDQSGAYNQYLLGHDDARFRKYQSAENYIRESLSKDSFFIPALVEMAMLQYRKICYDSAFWYSRRALSINTYDPQANYYYGLAADHLGQTYDALDGWEVAALSPSWRIAAWYQLAAAYFRRENWSRSREYLNKILKLQPSHGPSIKISLALTRITNDTVQENFKASLSKPVPINHFLAFESYLKTGKESDKKIFQTAIRNELPEQTYLEMAIWYAVKLNRNKEAIQLLEMAPQSNLIDYWLAYLTRNTNKSKDYLSRANRESAELVFPFRRESVPILEWAKSMASDWKPVYYLALIQAHTGNSTKARKLLSEVPDNLEFAPLYAWRSTLQESPALQEKDLRKAVNLHPENWRYVLNLSGFLMKHQRLEEAASLLSPFYGKHTMNYQAGMTLARLYLMEENPDQSEAILKNIEVLPYEGANESRVLYRSVKLVQALRSLRSGHYDRADKYVKESKLWPRNLGVGKPYDSQIDNSVEDQITTWIQRRQSGQPLTDTEIDNLKTKIMRRFFEFQEEAPF